METIFSGLNRSGSMWAVDIRCHSGTSHVLRSGSQVAAAALRARW